MLYIFYILYILYYIILYFILLYFIILYYIILYYIIYIILYFFIRISGVIKVNPQSLGGLRIKRRIADYERLFARRCAPCES